jgi:hypothetical protein
MFDSFQKEKKDFHQSNAFYRLLLQGFPKLWPHIPTTLSSGDLLFLDLDIF